MKNGDSVKIFCYSYMTVLKFWQVFDQYFDKKQQNKQNTSENLIVWKIITHFATRIYQPVNQ